MFKIPNKKTSRIYKNTISNIWELQIDSTKTNTVFDTLQHFVVDHSHPLITFMYQVVSNLCITPNFSGVQGLWLAVVKLPTYVYSITYKQTDEWQWSTDLGSQSYGDLATIFMFISKNAGPVLPDESPALHYQWAVLYHKLHLISSTNTDHWL